MPEKYGDPCATGNTQVLHVGDETSSTFGLARNLTDVGQFVVASFTGMCVGVMGLATDGQNATLMNTAVINGA